MNVHLRAIENLSTDLDKAVVVWTTTPSILQTALDEEADGEILDNISSWNELIDLIAADDVECRLTSDDQFLSAATYASSALLNKDLDINPTCDYLSSGEGDGTPLASSTLWVLEIDPELSEAERKEIQVEIRNLLDGISAESSIDYGVISLDLSLIHI